MAQPEGLGPDAGLPLPPDDTDPRLQMAAEIIGRHDADEAERAGADESEAEREENARLWLEGWRETLAEAKEAGPAVADEYHKRVVAAKANPGKGREEVTQDADPDDEDQNPVTYWRPRRTAEEIAAEELTPDVIIAGIVRHRPPLRSLRGIWARITPDSITESIRREDGGAIGWTVLSRQIETGRTAAAKEEKVKTASTSHNMEDFDADDEEPAAAAQPEEEPKHDPTKDLEQIVLTSDGRLVRIVGPDTDKRDGTQRFAHVKVRKGMGEWRTKRETKVLEAYQERNAERRTLRDRIPFLNRGRETQYNYTPPEVARLVGVISLKKLAHGFDLGPVGQELEAADVWEALDDFRAKHGIPFPEYAGTDPSDEPVAEA